MFDLTFKYVLVSDEDYYNCGQIVGKVSDEFYLVKFDSPTAHSIVRMFHIFKMSSDEGHKDWYSFDTAEELRNYMNWLNSPDDTTENNVLKLVKS